MPVRIQCVLFVKLPEDTSASESFALLPPEFLDHPACAIFSKINIHVISNSQVKINKNVHFRVIETFLDELKSNVASSKKPVCLYVNVCDNEFVQRLFNKCNFKIVTRFRGAKTHLCVENNLLVIEEFLKADAIFEYVSDSIVGTLIHFAVDKGCKGLLELLIKYGADINISTKPDVFTLESGFTLLHVAAKRTDLNIVELLLKNGADIECKNDFGATPLHLAVQYSSLEVVQCLVENGADYEARRSDGLSPLHIAAEVNSFQNAGYLLQRGANPNSTLEEGRDRAFKGATPLHLAVIGKGAETTKLLVENGANVNARCSYGHTALYFAIEQGHIDAIEFILSCHPDVNDVRNQRAFRIAFSKCAKHMKSAVEKMLEVGFTIERKHKNEPDFLFGAIYKNMFEIVEKLLDFGADVNQVHPFKSQKQFRPLHLAVLHANTRLIQLLLDRGANVNAVRILPRTEKTPLLDAIDRGDKTVFQLLLSYGADINSNRLNPLISIIKSPPKDPQTFELLLENGADPNVRTDSEETPLSTALCEGRLEVVELLLKFGAGFSFEEGQRARNAVTLQTFLDYGFVCPKSNDENGVKKLFNYYDWWSGNNRHPWQLETCSEKAKILACHVLKIDAAHESVDMRPLIPTAVFELFDSNDFLSRCKAEVSLMKSTKIGRTSVTFYEILTKADEISRYSRNEGFIAKFESCDIEKKFPIYGSILKCHFRQGTERRTLLKTAIKMLKSLFSQFTSLPDEIKEKIVELLNNQDILILKNCLNMK